MWANSRHVAADWWFVLVYCCSHITADAWYCQFYDDVGDVCVSGWKSDKVGSPAVGYRLYRAGSRCWESTDESNCWTCAARPRRSCTQSSWTCIKCILFSDLSLPMTPTVAIWVQLNSILCQIGLSRHFHFLTSGHSHSALISHFVN